MKQVYQSDIKHFWIQTATGKQFFVENPCPEDVEAEDIAHSLPKICRYAGHCIEFYSVGEHSVIVADELMRRHNDFELARAGLMHDAPEGYLTDLPSPIKKLCRDYQRLEGKTGSAIERRFDLKYSLDDDRIRRVDFDVFLAEKNQIMKYPWEVPGEPADVKMQCLSPEDAKEYLFEAMKRYKFL